MTDEEKFYDLISDIEMHIWLLCRPPWKKRSHGPISAVRKVYEDRKMRLVVEDSMECTVYLAWIRRDVEGQSQTKESILVFRVIHKRYLSKGREVLTFRFGRWVEYLTVARSQRRLPDYEPDLADGTDLLVDLEET